jgi:hypothetical protein
MEWRVMGTDKGGFRDVEMVDGVGWGCDSIVSGDLWAGRLHSGEWRVRAIKQEIRCRSHY